MKIKLFIPMAGVLQVEAGDKLFLLSMGDVATRPYEFDTETVGLPVSVPILVKETGLLRVPND